MRLTIRLATAGLAACAMAAPVWCAATDWGRGPADKLARGFKAALAELGKHGKAA